MNKKLKIEQCAAPALTGGDGELDRKLYRLAELERDKARLDWLDEHMSFHGGGSGGTYSFTTPADVEGGLLRVAIDAAAAMNPKQP